MDVHTPEQRRRNMAAVRSKNTKPEIAIRKLLFSLGYRFRLHRKDLPGKPDIALPKYKIAIFVNGCFWHRHEGCRHASIPATRSEWWQSKLDSNVARDRRNYTRLHEMGWRVVIIWECELRSILQTHTIPGLDSRITS